MNYDIKDLKNTRPKLDYFNGNIVLSNSDYSKALKYLRIGNAMLNKIGATESEKKIRKPIEDEIFGFLKQVSGRDRVSLLEDL